MKPSAAVVLVVAVMVAASVAQPDPVDVADRAISQVVQQPLSGQFWSWGYGPAIQMSAMYDVSKSMNQDWTRALDKRLDSWLSNSSEPAFQWLHNFTEPWNDAVGDTNGLSPIAFLSRYAFFNENTSSVDWQVAINVADQWVMRWPKRLPDASRTFSRDSGWGNEPDKNASFLWSDDQFMGLTLIARLAALGAPNAAVYLDAAASMQVAYASYMRDAATGLFYHGYDFASNQTSCCYWGRANGWVLMAHVEVLSALKAVNPTHPLYSTLFQIFVNHVNSMVAVQSTDGRWHQVLNESSTYLETSVTAMAVYSLATGVMQGWLQRVRYDSAIQLAWAALADTVAADGTVSGICTGTGVQVSVADYQARSTDYATCQPGLGSVFRAASAYYLYSQTE